VTLRMTLPNAADDRWFLRLQIEAD
jgi:hypothetical protein